MQSKLKFHTKGKTKIYTLKQKINNQPTKEAHYKFLKIKDAPKTGFKSIANS